MIRVHTDAGNLATEMAGIAAGLDASIVKITRNAGRSMTKAVKSHAPRGTGRYRRSWGTKFLALPGGAASTSGTDEPYGYRLEAGFSGVDSAGKVMSQPPQPHVEPAVAEVGPVFIAQVEGAVRVWMPDRPRSWGPR